MVSGRAFHDCLRTWHKTYDREEALGQIIDAFGHEGINSPFFKDYEKALEDLTIICMAYTNRYKKDPDIRFVDLEKYFETDINGTLVKFIPDGLGIAHGKSMIVEQKSVQQIDKNFKFRMKIDTQTNIYTYLLGKVGGLTIPEVILYRISKKTSLRQNKKEDRQQYIMRAAMDYTERPDYYFSDDLFDVRPYLVQQSGAEFMQILATINGNFNICTNCKSKNNNPQICGACSLWWKDTSKCSFMGGCQYDGLCLDWNKYKNKYTRKKSIIM